MPAALRQLHDHPEPKHVKHFEHTLTYQPADWKSWDTWRLLVLVQWLNLQNWL